MKLLKNHTGEKFKVVSSKYSLIAFFYDSTGFLECISKDRPAVLILGDEKKLIDPTFEELFEKLFSVGLAYEKPDEFVEWWNSTKGNIQGWWNSNPVNLIKMEIKKSIIQDQISPIKTLRHIFKY